MTRERIEVHVERPVDPHSRVLGQEDVITVDGALVRVEQG